MPQEGAMATKGSQKGAKNEPKFTKKTYFGDYCAQGLISTCFLSNVEAIYARNAPEILRKTVQVSWPARTCETMFRLRLRERIEARTLQKS